MSGARRSCSRSFRPDGVVGTGGYVCGPVVYATARLGIPSFISEQKAIPGLTTRFLVRCADAVVGVSFREGGFPLREGEASGLHRQSVLGKRHPRKAPPRAKAWPLRACARQQSRADGGEKQRRESDKRSDVDMAPKLARLPDVHFVFVTEETYYKATRERIAQTGALHSKQLRLVSYLHNMAQVLVDSSLIVRGSGAFSPAENEGVRPAGDFNSVA